MTKVMFLQNVIYIISILGIVMGIDLLLGAKVTSKLNKKLDKTVLDFDKLVAGALSGFRKTLDTSVNIDEKIIKTKTRVILGVLFITVCVVLILVARQS